MGRNPTFCNFTCSINDSDDVIQSQNEDLTDHRNQRWLDSSKTVDDYSLGNDDKEYNKRNTYGTEWC
jgi:hypothetical protein